MATKFYLRATTSNVGTLVRTEKSSTLPVGTLDDSGNAAKDLSLTKGSSQTSQTNVSLGQTGQQSQYMGKFIGPTLPAVNLTAQTWTVALGLQESAAQANSYLRVSVYVLTSSDTVRGFVYDGAADLGVEFSSSADGQVVTFSGSAVTGVQATDRLVLEVWVVATQSNATTRTNTLYYDGATDVTDSSTSDMASYISTPQDIYSAYITTTTVAATTSVPTPTVHASSAGTVGNVAGATTVPTPTISTLPTSYTVTTGANPRTYIGRIGPFADGNGNLYLILRDDTDNYLLKAFKSDNGGSTWSEVDSSNRPNHNSADEVLAWDCFQKGDTLYVASFTDTSAEVYFHTFRTSDHATEASRDTWGTTDKLVADYTNTDYEYGVAIAVQSDGDILILSNGDNGTYYTGRECVEYHYSQNGGSTWTTKQTFLGTDSDNISWGLVLGASGKIHGFGKEESQDRVIHRSLSDVTGSWTAAETISSGQTPTGFNYSAPRGGAYYDDGGVERITYGFLIGEQGVEPCTAYTTKIDDDGTPDTPDLLTSTNIAPSASTDANYAAVFGWTLAVDAGVKKVYAVFIADTSRDIYYRVNEDDGGWGASDIAFQTGITADSLGAAVYVRSGTAYLGVVWDDSGPDGTTKFTALELRAVSDSASVTPTTVQAVASVPTPTSAASAAHTTTTVQAAVQTFPSPTTAAAASVIAGNIVAQVYMDTPVVAAVRNASIVAGDVQALAALDTPTTTAEARAPPDAVAAQAAIPTPTVAASAQPQAGDVAASSSVPTPTTTASSSTTAGNVLASAQVEVPVVTASASPTAGDLAASAAVPTPAVSTGDEVNASVTFLDPPQNLALTVVSGVQIDLDWDVVTGASTYLIERDGVVVDTSDTNSYSDTGLDPNTEYRYRVKGVA